MKRRSYCSHIPLALTPHSWLPRAAEQIPYDGAGTDNVLARDELDILRIRLGHAAFPLIFRYGGILDGELIQSLEAS